MYFTCLKSKWNVPLAYLNQESWSDLAASVCSTENAGFGVGPLQTSFSAACDIYLYSFLNGCFTPLHSLRKKMSHREKIRFCKRFGFFLPHKGHEALKPFLTDWNRTVTVIFCKCTDIQSWMQIYFWPGVAIRCQRFKPLPTESRVPPAIFTLGENSNGPFICWSLWADIGSEKQQTGCYCFYW